MCFFFCSHGWFFTISVNNSAPEYVAGISFLEHHRHMKKFWRILKKVTTIAAVLSCVALFLVVLTSAVKTQHRLTCKKLNVHIDYDSGLAFLSESDIKQRVHYLSGDSIIGKTISTIDFKTIEKDISKNPFVARAEVFVNQQQEITIDIIQKRPILRILNNDGVGYYISENNERIPLCNKFTPRVAVAVGNVQLYQNPQRDSAVQNALYKLTLQIQQDTFLNALVDQIYVNENGEMDLLPKIEGHFIRFGDVDANTESKFNRLKIFYKEGLSKVGWDKYKSIDLRFNHQVVCEKNDTIHT